MGYYRDPNKRADYYYDKSQKFFLNYGGENLRMFCTRERVSYVKMLEVLGWTSVPQPKQTKPRKSIAKRTILATTTTSLRPLIIDGYRAEEISITIPKTHTFTDFGYPEHIGEVEKDKRVCRFCGKSNPVRVKNHSHDEVIFKDRSHAISYCLGNENLYCNEECDECNLWFGKNIEPDIEHRFSVYRAIHRFKNRENNERITEGDNFVIDHGTLTFVKESAFGVKTFSRSLNPGDIIPPEGVMANLVGKNGCVHANVYRCIAKYVVACLPKDELHAFQNTIEWVFKRKKPAHLPPMYRYEDASFVSRPLLRVFVRKDAKKDLPYCVAVLRAMDMVYCCAIPYCQPLDVGNSLLHIPMDIFVKKYYNDLRFKVEDFNIETPQIVVNHYILHSDKPLQAYNKQSVQVIADDINWTKLVINEKDGTTIQ